MENILLELTKDETVIVNEALLNLIENANTSYLDCFSHQEVAESILSRMWQTYREKVRFEAEHN